MQSRRDFLSLMPLAGSTLLGACGGGASGDAASAGEDAVVEGTATTTGVSKSGAQQKSAVPAAADQIPAYVVVEDWSSGVAVDAGRIDFTTLIREDKFADPALAADCTGWTEHGPSSVASLPILNGVQFSAKRFTIPIGGIYRKTSYRVLVMMRAIGLRDGLFGDVTGVRTFAGPHKLRITNVGGTELKRIEMRDGLPMNHPSLVNVPMDWTVTNRRAVGAPDVQVTGVRLPNNKPMRPHMSAGSSYVAFFGDEPESSAAVRNRIPRVNTSLWPSKNSKVRAIYNGDDVHLVDSRGYGGNGNAHPEVMPRWALSYDEVSALSTVVQNDPEIYGGQGSNWANALRVGWDYEPGALGGITRRSGPGGVRMDRTMLPGEIFQMALTQATRTNDGASTATMARGYTLNHANYPGYYPQSMLSLDAINTFSNAPQPTFSGTAINPVRHYYGSNGPDTDPGAVFIYDTYGGPPGPVAMAIEWANPGLRSEQSTASHPRNGWMPDSEHNNRGGTAWATLLYADPMFCRMAEHMMMFESHICQPILSRASEGLYGVNTDVSMTEPGRFWMSRGNVLPFCTATMMWWVASQQGTYSRSTIESVIHTFFARWKSEILDRSPTVAGAMNASQRAYGLTGLHVTWASWDANSNYSAGSGWVANFTIALMYVGHWFTLMKCSGLYDALMRNSTTAACLTGILKGLEFNARMFKDAPWAMAAAPLGPSIVLRTSSKGAVETDLSTLPSSYTDVVTNNPRLRTDDNWFLSAGAQPGVSSPSFNSYYSAHGRMQTARMWWDLFCAPGAERTAALSAVDTRIRQLAAYTPIFTDACFTRHNSAFSIPAFIDSAGV